ncbi:hypothetical protein [Absidia glauca]|uniref:Uncharacterized protein n=1 Tax=Absidia glauca TaxID=4829 RepID=A0A168SW33_ABSGL|nr:hypothetical protein [Absidia glauca]
MEGNETRKRKSNMLDDISPFAELSSKRLNATGDITQESQPVESIADIMKPRQLSPNAITRAYVSCNAPSYAMGNTTARPSTPPFSMTLAHYNESSGSYTSSILD